jgi:hypothetical protein
MLIQGIPFTTKLPGADIQGERFFYWRGASGRKYIHTIYPWGSCPPVPGAVFVAVRRVGGMRVALGVQRFSSVWDDACRMFRALDADEVHVHLLARDSAHADAVLSDLRAGLREEPMPDGLEVKSQPRLAA